MTYEVIVNGNSYRLQLEPGERAGEWRCRAQPAGSAQSRELRFDVASAGEEVLSLLCQGKSYACNRDPSGAALVLGGVRYAVEVRDPRALGSRRAATGGQDGPRQLSAPMPGKVLRLLVAEGARVEAGQGLLVVEAMKMQNELKSPKAGVVRKLLAREGAAVNAGETLAVVE